MNDTFSRDELDATLAVMLERVRADIAAHPDDKIGRRATRLGKELHIGDKWAIRLVHVAEGRPVRKPKGKPRKTVAA